MAAGRVGSGVEDGRGMGVAGCVVAVGARVAVAVGLGKGVKVGVGSRVGVGDETVAVAGGGVVA